jgi:hypothetical protein
VYQARQYLRKHPDATNAEVAKALKIGERSVSRARK